MLVAEANVQTERSSRYLVELCSHLDEVGRDNPEMQVRVEWSDDRGAISFDWGRCTLRSLPGVLTLRAEAPDRGALERLQHSVTDFLEGIGRGEDLTVVWASPQDAGVEPGVRPSGPAADRQDQDTVGEDRQPIIEARGLVKVYPGGTRALDGVSFRVDRGEVFAFLGPNGSGKTTTVKILTTLLRPTEGRVTVNGRDPVRQSDEVRRSFGIVFQETSVDDDLTALENMDFHGVLYDVPRDARKERNEQLLRLVGLWDRKDRLVGEFSGGLKRRLEIARAFVHRPRLLFLDEPTVGLDPQTRQSMWANLVDQSNADGTTIFFTTHYLEEAERVAQRIAIVDYGKIIATGTSDQLKRETDTASLEDAFLALTGRAIREEPAEGALRTTPTSGHAARRH